jgi:cytosine/adenosine deaminase-related metal-dependent hydrolase
MAARPISFVNARFGGRDARSLRIDRDRIDAVDVPPAAGDLVMDVAGECVLPGLINAHDHLQLNNFLRLRFRERYRNVGEWIRDIDTRRGTDRAITGPATLPREQRLLLGGLKNILSGVTTVAHHDPCYPSLREAAFPCRVLGDYGWSHSLGLDGEKSVRASYLATPARAPWFIHAGEGIDAVAGEEFARLERLGCIGANTRLIHGVAFSAVERSRLAERGGGLIWCPGSNLYLFDTTADCRDLIALGRVALGSDSRLSGERDLLDELRVARGQCGVAGPHLEGLVTTAAAQLLGLADRGTLAQGMLADCIVLPRDRPLGVARRAELRCVMLGGLMICGDADYAAVLMCPERRVAATIDGRAKVIDCMLADLLGCAPMHEAGVWRKQPGEAA